MFVPDARAARRHIRRRRWPTVDFVSQLSFFSAESVPPAVADLTGFSPPRAGGAGRQRTTRARGCRWWWIGLWRAEGLAEMIVEAGLQPEIARTEENTPLVRTAVDRGWCRRDWTRPSRRCRAMVARPARTAGLDPGRGQPGGRSLPAGPGSARPGYPFAACLGADAGGDSAHAHRHPRHPALRISGRRRLSRLVENVGEPPNVEAFSLWPPEARHRGSVASGRAGAKLAVANRADRRRTHDPAA